MPSLTPLLANFTPQELSLLSSFGDSRSYQAEEVVIRQGDENDHLYLVLKGKLDVFQDIDGMNKKVASLESGDSLGEVSVFDPGPASATVCAANETEVWLITRDSLDRLHAANPKVAYRLLSRITTCLSKRLRQMNDKVVDLVNR
ncbi:Cyclic nucleotide-binding domain-containing protein [Prosthecobacter fusiformis]|uniref:Cyclic nucleotide-binding domain-containing protein n=1 Tax=Prosthecobacter fusiformis TaxID=48464 RepID=A0A4R7RZN8_9BACT|nr:cyclic nucleotide-binding domain-containing protein [Prosthecobacter fusiformis]TDU71450.1 Cyclic nucleotide-binding domain-containing protein [Prosthecobacter fusiformis]